MTKETKSGADSGSMADAGEGVGGSDSAPAFASDDLGRVQQILFGDHVRKTHERIDTLEQALLGAIADLRAATAAQIENVEARILTETDNRTKAVARMGTRVDTEAENAAAAAAELQNELQSTSGRLENAIQGASGSARAAMDAMRQEVTADLDRVQVELRGDTVDRSALATMMSTVAAQLAGDAEADKA